MLYVFGTHLGIPGQPGRILTAGGLQFAIEEVEELAQLSHGGQITKEDHDGYRVSDFLLGLGIGWDWFTERHAFGNGTTRHKTSADYRTRIVVGGTDLDMEQYIRKHGALRLGEVELIGIHTEGWEVYERRWTPGTCPQESHEVHLTWLVTEQPVGEAEYKRIRAITEEGAEPLHLNHFSDHYFSELRPYKAAGY